MPTNVVKTPAQEKDWEKAKEIVRKQYPNVKEGTSKFYRLAMGIFQRITGKKRIKSQRSKYIVNKGAIKI